MGRYLLIIAAVLMVMWRPAEALDGQAVVEAGFNYMRGKTSVSVVTMTIQRPGWRRVMSIKAWTRGTDQSLFRTIAPSKDQGNGTLKKGREMWMYNPKVNRVIKIPPSMMSQSWMGSDFSNNDLAKSDSLITDYDHRIVATETDGDIKVYVIESIPKPDAPVVWGMQKLKIRSDHIFLMQQFFDEDLKPVKTMLTTDLQKMGDRLFPKSWRMQNAESPNEYTVLEYQSLVFDAELPRRQISLHALKNPGRRP